MEVIRDIQTFNLKFNDIKPEDTDIIDEFYTEFDESREEFMGFDAEKAGDEISLKYPNYIITVTGENAAGEIYQLHFHKGKHFKSTPKIIYTPLHEVILQLKK